MSEYQYYEFQAIDRPLTQEQVGTLRSYSTRAQITSTSFTNEYHWGDFKGDPIAWMDEYFDAFLHLANWGTRWLMIRVPKGAIDREALEHYCAGDSLSVRVKGDYVTLSFDAEIEPEGWVDGDGWLASMIALRSDLLHGDYRGLYLGWLLGVQQREVEETAVEPPVPPGLNDLNATLESLCDFLQLDPDLLEAAGESSGAPVDAGLSDAEIRNWVSKLSAAEKDHVLIQLVRGQDQHIGSDFRRRAKTELRASAPSSRTSQDDGRRTAATLLERAENLAREREERETVARERIDAERKRIAAEERQKFLESLIGKEEDVWNDVHSLVQTKQPRKYDEAVATILNLQEVAAMTEKMDEFRSRMEVVLERHSKKVSLIDRLRGHSLVP